MPYITLKEVIESYVYRESKLQKRTITTEEAIELIKNDFDKVKDGVDSGLFIDYKKGGK